MKKLVFMVAVLAALYACSGDQKSDSSKKAEAATEVVNTHKSDQTDNASIIGVYEGTLPAASSSGIKTKLTLNDDNSFTLHSEYIDEENGIFDDNGTYSVDGDILTATQENGTVYYYKIEDGILRMLNADKEEVTGELAENYILKQTERL